MICAPTIGGAFLIITYLAGQGRENRGK